MHIPDGIIPLNQALVYIAISAILVGISIWQSKERINRKQLIVVGVLSAGIFAAQMFNFPVPFGSSGHLIGTALATVLLGPWVAILILTSILFIQSMFGDGGLLALGANIFNMAILGAFSTVLLFLIIPKKWLKNKYAFAGFSAAAAFFSTMIMAIGASTELTIAQIGNTGLIFGWILGLHAIIGVAEAGITFAVVSFAFRADYSLFLLSQDSLFLKKQEKEVTSKEIPQYKFPVWALIITIIIFGFMSLFGIIASENPDGLERTLEVLSDEGFIVTIFKTGIFGFPEGLGWAILQLAIIMSLLFGLTLLISYGNYLYRKKRYNAIQKSIEE